MRMETLIIAGMIVLSVFFGVKQADTEKKLEAQQTKIEQQEKQLAEQQAKLSAQDGQIKSQQTNLARTSTKCENLSKISLGATQAQADAVKQGKEFDRFVYEVLEGQQEAIQNLEAKRVVEIDQRTGRILK